jgi:hypothetical protein
MEHMPEVSQSTVQLPHVQYTCTPHSAALSASFSDFPQAYGLNLAEFNFDNFNRLSPQNIAYFFQDWLFFRLLGDILSIGGLTFDRSAFITHDTQDRAYVTTKQLPSYLWYWLVSELNTPRDAKRRRYENVAAILRRASRVMMEIAASKFQPPWFLDLIFVSITLLGELLSHGALLVYDPESSATPVVTRPRSSAMVQLMRNARWCVNELDVHLGRELNTTLPYLSKFAQSNLFDHSNCTAENCNSNQLNWDEYRTKHASSCTGCLNLGPD